MCKPEINCRKDDAKQQSNRLSDLHKRCSTPQKIALERIETNGNIALELLSLLNDGYDLFLSQFAPFPCIRKTELNEEPNPAAESEMDVIGDSTSSFLRINPLYQILAFHKHLAKCDTILYEEVGRAGGHILLLKIIKLDPDDWDCEWREAEYDDFYMLKDAACEIGTLCRPSFPLPLSPYTKEVILKRLPLEFPLCGTKTQNKNPYPNILINQIQDRQSAQDDVGFVMWPSAVVLARWIAANPFFFRHKTILELGAGCGLSGIAAAIAARTVHNVDKSNGCIEGASKKKEKKSTKTEIFLTDFNEKVLENLNQNIILNGLEDSNVNSREGKHNVITKTAKLDFYMHKAPSKIEDNCFYDGDQKLQSIKPRVERGWIDGTTGLTREPVDIILGADIICKPEDATAVSNTIFRSLKKGGEAILICADSKHRFGMDIFKDELEKINCFQVRCFNVTKMEEGEYGSLYDKPEESGLDLTSGYVDGMNLLFFRVKRIETKNDTK